MKLIFENDSRLVKQLLNYLMMVSLSLNLVGCNSGNSQTANILSKGMPAMEYKSKTTQNSCRQYAYINFNKSNTIQSLVINAQNGDIIPLQLPLMPTGLNPGSFYTHPNGKFVYVLGGDDGSISVYSINHETGQLTQIQKTYIPSRAITWSGNMTPKTGKYFYVCDNSSNVIVMFKVDPDTGLLTLNKTDEYPNGIIREPRGAVAPNSIKITANLKWAFVNNYQSNNLVIYRYDDNTGNLILAESANIVPIKNCINPRQIALSPAAVPSDPSSVPDPKQVYVLCQQSNTIVQFDLDKDQRIIIPKTTPPVVSTRGVSPTSMSIESEYKYIYVPNMGSNTIAQFSMARDTGYLAPLEPPTVPGGIQNKGIYTNMGYVYVTNFATNSISIYKQHPQNGSLTKIGVDVALKGVEPGNITFTPYPKNCH